MVMEKASPLLVGWEFVRQHYPLLNQAPDMLHRFYGRNSSYIHGGLDSNRKPADAVYGQKEIHRKVMSRNFTKCHTKILHVDAYAKLNDGVVVQVLGLLSNNNQALRRFMQMFVLALEGSVANQFYVHNDIFREQDEVFGGLRRKCVSEIQEEKSELVLEETAPEDAQKSSSPAPADISQTVWEDLRTFSWVSETSNNLQPSGAVPVTGIPPYVEQRINIPPQKGPRPICETGEQGDIEPQRMVRHPDSHQLFFGNLLHEVDKSELKDFFQNYGNVVELRINSGGKLPSFGFVVFDDSEPVQKVLSNRPIMFRGEVRLNVEEKKTRAAREGDRRDDYLRGPGGPLCGLGGEMRGPPRGGMVQKAGFEVGRGLAPWQ
uniref:Ras GTPase-activating protein-binding protein 1 n=1 Tax=Nomascus leucogenys TaxID=61853 RepID=A0A2I3GLE2_NOMLE